MTDETPVIEIVDVTKNYGGLRPLRMRRLVMGSRERLAVSGLDAGGAETLVHLITGASVPDAGTVRVAGRDTREIATDTEWLASLDRFGIVTRRAVLIESLSIVANLALPMTLSIDPMAPDTRAAVEALADAVGLSLSRLDAPASSLTPGELVRVHLARALAMKPELLLLEHPTAAIEDQAVSEDLGRTLLAAASAREVGWLALTEDAAFIRASTSTARRLAPATGELSGASWWKKLVR